MVERTEVAFGRKLYRLECKRCGFSLVRRKDEALSAVES